MKGLIDFLTGSSESAKVCTLFIVSSREAGLAREVLSAKVCKVINDHLRFDRYEIL